MRMFKLLQKRECNVPYVLRTLAFHVLIIAPWRKILSKLNRERGSPHSVYPEMANSMMKNVWEKYLVIRIKPRGGVRSLIVISRKLVHLTSFFRAIYLKIRTKLDPKHKSHFAKFKIFINWNFEKKICFNLLREQSKKLWCRKLSGMTQNLVSTWKDLRVTRNRVHHTEKKYL